MNLRGNIRRSTHALLMVTGVAGSMLATGCVADYSGQTLPSPYYLSDDVQYYAPGAEFLLPNEAAAMEAQKAEIVSTPQ